MERLESKDISAFLIQIGGILAIILGIFEVIRGLVVLLATAFLQAVLSPLILSTFLAPLAPLIPWIGGTLAVVYVILGIIVAAIGYRLYKLGTPPLPKGERDRWIVLTAIFLSLALILGHTWLAIALAVSLAGLVLSPTNQAPVTPTPPPPTHSL